MAAIAGFGVAAALASEGLSKAVPMIQEGSQWRDAFEPRLLALEPGTMICSRDADRLPQTSCFALPDRSAETLLMALDLAGFAFSSHGKM